MRSEAQQRICKQLPATIICNTVTSTSKKLIILYIGKLYPPDFIGTRGESLYQLIAHFRLFQLLKIIIIIPGHISFI